MRRRLLALGGCVVLAAAGCSNGMHDAAPTTTQPPPATSTAPNPDVVPPVITTPYVNAVLAQLFHVYGNATRALVATKQVSEAVREDFRAIYNDPLYAEEIRVAAESLQGAITNVRPHPGDGQVLVVSLIGGSPTCIFVETHSDLSAVLIHPTPIPASEYYELGLKQPNIDPTHLNPTPWAIEYNAAYLTSTAVSNRCG